MLHANIYLTILIKTAACAERCNKHTNVRIYNIIMKCNNIVKNTLTNKFITLFSNIHIQANGQNFL